MKNFLFLLAVILFSGYKTFQFDTIELKVLFTFICIIGAIFMFIHLIYWLNKRYYCDLFIAQRDAYEATLKNARANGFDLEALKTLKSTTEWNEKLATEKVDYNHFIWGCYVDKRYLDLKPIFSE